MPPRRLTVVRLLPLAAFIVSAGCASATFAYTPESPEVKAAVERAATFLQTDRDQRLGARALSARVMVYLHRVGDPCVALAVDAVRKEIANPNPDGSSVIYSTGLAIALLVELDAVRYRTELDGLVKMLLQRQKPNGAWGYPDRPTGDTSMTQYAIYGLWNAARAGVAIDNRVWEGAVDWLLRTQDPSGAWGYQGQEARGAELVRQFEIRRSMVEAALASLYLGGERFGVWRFGSLSSADVSKLLRPVDQPGVPAGKAPFDLARFRTALAAGEEWDRNTNESIYEQYPCYHLYTIERLQAFRSAALGKEDSAAWYDQGVERLLKEQRPDGGWSTGEGPQAATGFAALFLMRSTQRSLKQVERVGTGTLVGGRGLPALPGPTANETPGKDGQPPRPGESMLDLARRIQQPEFAAWLANLERSSAASAGRQPNGASGEKESPSEFKKRLLELAGEQSPAAQATVLKALGRNGNLDDVPLLIDAIGDPEPQVHQAAVDALRYLARRSEEVGRPLPADAASRQAEATRWREWLRTIRPGK
jgi:hypothetical protein